MTHSQRLGRQIALILGQISHHQGHAFNDRHATCGKRFELARIVRDQANLADSKMSEHEKGVSTGPYRSDLSFETEKRIDGSFDLRADGTSDTLVILAG
ncbi:MAG TPA: hypothetical protein VK660_02820 [Xanthomonadaceae bacterium]|jgi:hypothetical protein|nr:hypothetical protein [Xanthomonadaceae bacterium]